MSHLNALGGGGGGAAAAVPSTTVTSADTGNSLSDNVLVIKTVQIAPVRIKGNPYRDEYYVSERRDSHHQYG